MSDELTLRLRELAEYAETPPPGSGAEVRAAAGRRRRRRRTTAAVAGGCAAAGLAAVLTLNAASHGGEQRPSAASSAEPGTESSAESGAKRAVPDATVDLSRRVLTVAGRELPVSAGAVRTPTPTGLMTVTAKRSLKVVPITVAGADDGYGVKLAWVLDLAPADGTGASEATDGTDGTGGAEPAETAAGTGPEPGAEERVTPDAGPSQGPVDSDSDSDLWIAALGYDEKAPGTYDATSGWIGLRTTDAQWLYRRLQTGALVEIRGTAPTPPTTAPTPTPTPTMTPSSG
ncbi:L,D-transpeptidase [Streptomyces griseiscabiei]|uniref:L,D-transpeptidase n=1 Tax=Streptomyces griseiscabiei TaxID=2993540 RepID=A0ABU4LJ43_9ACTN|nr:L,D-transpeptidase [Streptomyces griseiscabiei]MDX2915821.1 L,D-transpeptidase [Streptomyces griseiscabiei]